MSEKIDPKAIHVVVHTQDKDGNLHSLAGIARSSELYTDIPIGHKVMGISERQDYDNAHHVSKRNIQGLIKDNHGTDMEQVHDVLWLDGEKTTESIGARFGGGRFRGGFRGMRPGRGYGRRPLLWGYNYPYYPLYESPLPLLANGIVDTVAGIASLL